MMRLFIDDEKGAVSASSIGWAVLCLVLGGIAVDTSNAWRVRTELQGTADAAAHAAVVYITDTDTARTEAIRLAEANMPPERFGTVLQPENVIFGVYDPQADTFSPSGGTPNAVRVITERTSENGNAVATFLLRLGILGSWDVRAQSVFYAEDPDCFQDGLISNGIVEVSSNNPFMNGICIHGYNGVKMSQSNTFDDSTVVSMSDLSLLQTPSGDLGSNPGLEDVLAESKLRPKLPDEIDDIIFDLRDVDSPTQPSYIRDNPLRMKANLTAQQFNNLPLLVPGTVYEVTGPNGCSLQIGKGGVVAGVVVVTECRAAFGQNTLVTNSTIATSSTFEGAVTGASGVVLGAEDDCAQGGGAQILSKGSVNFASTMRFNGSQIVSQDTVSLAADSGGINGVSIEANGEIKVTSNGAFGTCSGNVDREYARFGKNVHVQ